MSRFAAIAFAHPGRKRDTRNTDTSFRCRECEGTGAHGIHVGNPYRETYKACRECIGTGWVQWRQDDVLLRLQHARRVGFKPYYQQLRVRAFAPVRLEH